MKEQLRRPYRRAEETRRHVLDVAAPLFYAEGIHTVGIDRVAREADVTTTTLYRLFGSKDGLVLAYMQRKDQEASEMLERALATGGISRFFDELDESARQPDNRGCPFRLAMTEYPVLDCDVHCLGAAQKERTRARFREVLAAQAFPEPDLRADQLMLIFDGIEASAAGRDANSPPGPGPALVREILGLPPSG
jgi:AcrR family transcriptional regulator